MSNRHRLPALLVGIAGLGLAGPAFAQSPQPEPPSPEVPGRDDVRSYAGMGSGIAYAEAGVAEFGGSASLSAGTDFTSVAADPMIGYFPWDNVELSAIIGVRILNLEDTTRSQYTALLEPSLHIPVGDTFFIFGGIGAGLGVAPTPDQTYTGFALAPRLGGQFLVGRSGLLNLGARYSMTFASADVDTDLGPFVGNAVLAFVNTFDVQAGYTVMF